MELFKKVFIKSEADLPTKGDHWMHSNQKMGMNWVPEGMLEYQRIEDVDWYLQPEPEMTEKWISVNDKLPKESCTVLVATDKGGVGEMWFSDELKWYVLKDNAKVTHWMELPKHPIDHKVK